MKKVELLAPAGGIKQYIAAVENGADAIYLGGTLYNARMNAANFTLPEMEQAIDYGHLRGVKTYVTVNTLLKDDELDKALDYVKKLYQIGVDALIIQDLGLGKLVYEVLPDFPLHASTQASIYNKEGVLAAKKLGYSRAVLARELSIEEIKDACGILEIESFVHGALCFCYSGQCQLSRSIGGRSGNKGGCAQPCRLPYRGGEGEYPLSPKDLNMIDHIGELIDAGVTSFKIEGRMKSPEYVATVTRIYRKYIDEYLKKGRYTVSFEDRMDLMQIFNRGGFTDGYALKDPEEKLLSGVLPKNQGINVGIIDKPYKNGLLADLRLSGPLKMGDVIEVHSGEMFTTKVTYFEELPNGVVRIGDMKENVAHGDKVYRIVSEDLMKKAARTFEEINFDSGKFIRKTDVNFTLIAKLREPLKLTAVTSVDGRGAQATAYAGDFIVEEAKSRGTSEDDVRTQLMKTGGTPFEFAKLKFIADENIYIPQSKLNELRRYCLEDLANQIKASYKRETVATKIKYSAVAASKQDRRFELFFYSFDEFESCNMKSLLEMVGSLGIDRSKIYALLPIFDAYEYASLIAALSDKYNLQIIPYVPNVIKGKADARLKAEINEIINVISKLSKKVYVGNISHIELFKANGMTVLADYGLNIYNEESKLAYESLGAEDGVLSLEALDSGFGRIPLMTTEHLMNTSSLTDRKGKAYDVIQNRETHKSIITVKEAAIDWDMLKEKWQESEDNLRIYI